MSPLRVTVLIRRAATAVALRAAVEAGRGAVAVVRRIERDAERATTRIRQLEPGA